MVPPRRMRFAFDDVEEKSMQGRAIWSKRVVDPAVPGSAVYVFDTLIEPGSNSIVEEPIVQPVNVAEDMSATRLRPARFESALV